MQVLEGRESSNRLFTLTNDKVAHDQRLGASKGAKEGARERGRDTQSCTHTGFIQNSIEAGGVLAHTACEG